MKARKDYICFFCSEVIEKGEDYARVKAVLTNVAVPRRGIFGVEVAEKAVESLPIHTRCLEEVEAEVDPVEFFKRDLGAKKVFIEE